MQQRIIKFRAWTGEQMVFPDCIDRIGRAHWKENSISEISRQLMQFTGIVDKNGKEIFEGDILRDYTSSGKLIHMSEVCFGDTFQFMEEGYYGWYLKLIKSGFNTPAKACQLNSSCRMSEVIGNIYENPELIPSK